MREDSGPSRGMNRGDTGESARRANAPVRSRQPAFPFWVIRGTRGQGEPQTGTRNAAPLAARLKGRTGVDLRAGVGSVQREPSTPARSQPHKRRAPWRRAARPTPAPAAVATVATVTEAMAARRAKRRRVRINYGLVLLALAQSAVLGLAAWGLTSPTWQVRYVQVTGTQDAALAAAIRRLPLTGCNIFRCDTARQARLVEALPAVASAEVHAAYPDGEIVVVTPRHPALLWQANGQDVVVASDGTVLGAPESDPAYARAALPHVLDDTGAVFGGRTPEPGAKMPVNMVEMAGQLRNGMASALGGNGWTLHYAPDNGFIALAPNGEQVIFGTPSDAASVVMVAQSPSILGVAPESATVDAGVQAQLAEVQSLNTLLAGRGQKPSLIDVRWGAHPYYRTD